MNAGLVAVVCLVRENTRSPAVCGAAELIGRGFRVLAYDPFPAGKPAWVPAAVVYRPRPKKSPLYLYMAEIANEVIAEAPEDVIAFLADDVIVTASALQRHVQAQRASGGAVVVTPVAGVRIGPGHAIGSSWLEKVAPWALIGDCWSAPVSAVREIGGFDRQASMVTRGDEDAAWRMWSGGLPVVIDRAIRLEREAGGYPGSRWRGFAHQQLGRRRGGEYARAWDEVCRAQTKITDHNRYHDRRAIMGCSALEKWRHQLTGQVPRHTVAVPVYTEDDAIRALGLSGQHELLFLDRSPVEQSHLVAARGAAGGARVIRDEPMLAAGSLAALDLKLSGSAADAQVLSRIRDALRRERKRIVHSWPRWLAAAADGDTIALAQLPTAEPPVGRVVRSSSSHGDPDWTWGSFEQGYAGPPRAVAIRITNRCNMRCAMCGQHGPNGNMAGVRETELPLDGLLSVVQEAASFGAGMLYVWGGEPFLRPDAVDLLAAASHAGLFTVVTTNGYHLREVASDLVGMPLDSLRLSLDGPPAHPRPHSRRRWSVQPGVGRTDGAGTAQTAARAAGAGGGDRVHDLSSQLPPPRGDGADRS